MTKWKLPEGRAPMTDAPERIQSWETLDDYGQWATDYDIEDAPEDGLHPCLERVEKLVVKAGVYGSFVVCKKLNGRVYVYLSKENITPNDFAQAAALFTALAMATEGVE